MLPLQVVTAARGLHVTDLEEFAQQIRLRCRIRRIQIRNRRINDLEFLRKDSPEFAVQVIRDGPSCQTTGHRESRPYQAVVL